MPPPRLSIVAPTFNRAHMLPRLLDSVRTVTMDCEVLVVDNASTDETPAVVADFASRDARIRHIRNSENIGVIANFNRAMELASGDYICCLGDDDATLPGNFERKLALLESNLTVGLVYSLWQRMDQHGRQLGVCMWPGLLRHSYLGGRSEFLDMLPACYIMLQSVVFRRSLFIEHGGFDLDSGTTAGHDWDMLLRWLRETETAYIAEPLVCVGVHEKSHTESVCRANGEFARGRIDLWRKWLVTAENPPVLDDSRWQRMRDAFVPDLRHELGDDERQIAGYLRELEQLRQAHDCRVLQRFECLAGLEAPPMLGGAASDFKVPAHDTRPQLSPGAPVPIVWHAPVRDPSGYADEARHFLFALAGDSADVAARELRWNNRLAALPAERERTLTRLLISPARDYSVHVWHILAPHFQTAERARANIGRTMFETDSLPPDWAEACNAMDAVWVPTEFNRETFSRSGVDPKRIRIVPGALDMTPYTGDITPLRIDGARGFNFLSVFDWTLRKGWDVLIRAYVEEFTADEDVALLFKIHSSLGQSLEQIVGEIEQFLTGTLDRDPNRVADIVVQDTNISDAQMPSLYRTADCYVMPTRGEGWGRPLMEAMAMGLPTIATNWSGQTGFMSKSNSMLIDCTIEEVPDEALTQIPTYRGHRWAEPSVEHLRALMRRTFEDRESGRALGEQARNDIAEQFNYTRVSQIITEELERFR